LALKHRARRPSGLTSTMTFSPSTPCAPVLSVPLCENDGAMMHDSVGHWNGWRGRRGQYVTELPNQTTELRGPLSISGTGDPVCATPEGITFTPAAPMSA
jgi:hypothetical protein